MELRHPILDPGDYWAVEHISVYGE